jgi:phosphoribosylaminoimidazole-succinocarboxamide synthase
MYNHANKIAQEKWIIIWDTKFEFWLDKDWNLTVIDEVLTPDSSRFWTKKGFQEWVEPESFDKQPVRDYVEAYWKENSDENWKKLWEKGFKKYPVELPQEVIEACQERYIKMWIVFS